MSHLKEQLNEYLSRNDHGKKNGISFSTSAHSFSKLFRKIETEENEDLLTNNQKYFSNCDLCFSLNRFQKIIGFCICISISMMFFGLSMFYIPVILLKARKFALLFTIGSCSFLCSFCFLWGPVNYFKHICSKERLPFTIVYFSSLFTTFYFSLWMQSTPLTALSAVIQIVSIIWFFITYIPGGQTGFTFFRKLFTSTVTASVSKTLPV